MCVAFFGLFRKDNITVGKPNAFNPRAHLTVSDFMVKDGELWVRVGHSKTNQFQKRCHWVPLVRMPGHLLCPIAAVMRAMAVHPTKQDYDSMFCWRAGAQTRPMTHSNFVGGFKALVRALGLDWSKFSGHSFRRGGATYCFNLGVDDTLIKLLGDWSSDAYLLYDETTKERRLELPRAMAAAILGGKLTAGARLE
jgi:integrase